jgi:hypothetical protein
LGALLVPREVELRANWEQLNCSDTRVPEHNLGTRKFVASFDKDFDKFPAVTRYEPAP